MSARRAPSIDESPRDTSGSSGPPLIHSYPRDPMYRKSGMAVPQPGDVARCGWVKKIPPVGGRPVVSCVVCADLQARSVAR
jgi:hypothetical protein